MLQTNHFHYTSIQWNSMQQSFSAKDRGLNQSRRVPPFMEPDSSLSCSQNARIELLHIVGVHESSDFIINFIFFFPRCILVTYAVSSKLCNLNVVQTAISTIPPTSSSYFFFPHFVQYYIFLEGPVCQIYNNTLLSEFNLPGPSQLQILPSVLYFQKPSVCIFHIY